MSNRDEAQRLRVRDVAIADRLTVSPTPSDSGCPCLVAQTVRISTYPSSPQQFFACSPVATLGAETEGGAAVLTTSPSTFFALNLGGVVPPLGTYVVASFVGNRWVFRYDA